jgi:hypothetical protein
MRIALIYNRKSRVAIGERSHAILAQYPSLKLQQFDLSEAQAIKGGFDLYLRLDDGDYSVDIPSHLRPRAWWIADTHLKKPFRSIVRNSKSYDYRFCCQREGAQRLEGIINEKVHWLPPAADEAAANFIVPPFNQRRWDVCFIGTLGKFSLRRVMLEVIEENFPNNFIGQAPYEQLPYYYGHSRLTANYPINNDINMRFFEAMGAGGLVLSTPVKGNGFEELFTIGKHCDVFEGLPEEMVEKVKFYLANPQKSYAMAQEAFKHIQTKHTYRVRLKEMFNAMGLRLE